MGVIRRIELLLRRRDEVWMDREINCNCKARSIWAIGWLFDEIWIPC